MTAATPGKLARQALEFVEALKQIAARAAQGDCAVWAWDRLAQNVATDDFLYVGRSKEALRWPDFVTWLDRWSRIDGPSSIVRRIEQSGNLVFLQLVERCTIDGAVRTLTTMTILEFDTSDRLRRIDSFQ